MVSMTMQQSRRIAFATLLVALMGTAGCEDHWKDDSHETGPRSLATVPECPHTWDTIAVFPAKTGDRPLPPTVSGSSALNASGPITNIPEFHDCQKFIIPAAASVPAHYDSLYAIFAAFKLDSIGGALPFDAYTWSSSNTAVATVDASGHVTGVAAGSAAIIATSTADPTHKAYVQVTVTTSAPPVTPIPVVAPASGIFVQVGASFLVVANLGANTTTSLPVAEIYTYGPGYSPLGIGPNFNCLYLYFDASGNLSAKMVKVGGAGDGACFGGADPNTLVGTPLSVIRSAGLAVDDYPPVARWDWDPVNNLQYIGIKCGAAWCEIGSREAHPFTVSASHVPAGGSAPRVLAVKGWYDEQFLAIKNDARQWIPSGLKGMVIPDPNLASKHEADFAAGWVPVAYVGLDTMSGATAAAKYYKQKFNFDPVHAQLPLSRMNTLSLCYGTRSHCGVPIPTNPAIGCGPDQKLPFIWFIRRVWVKLESASRDRVLYRCVTRRDNLAAVTALGISTPATTRWRWLALDETTWAYCDVAGCCETNGDGVSVGWQ